jgi:hypothetical protein
MYDVSSHLTNLFKDYWYSICFITCSDYVVVPDTQGNWKNGISGEATVSDFNVPPESGKRIKALISEI